MYGSILIHWFFVGFTMLDLPEMRTRTHHTVLHLPEMRTRTHHIVLDLTEMRTSTHHTAKLQDTLRHT